MKFFQFSVYDFHPVKTSLTKHVLLVWITYFNPSHLSPLHSTGFSTSVYSLLVECHFLIFRQQLAIYIAGNWLGSNDLPSCLEKLFQFFFFFNKFISRFFFLLKWLPLWKRWFLAMSLSLFLLRVEQIQRNLAHIKLPKQSCMMKCGLNKARDPLSWNDWY